MIRNGFTLVEMMVVLLVMALAGGAVVMVVGSGGASVGQDAARLASRVAAARETAITGARPVSLWVSASGYGFDRYSGGKWQAEERGALKSSDWDEGITVTTSGISGQGAKLSGGAARLTFDNLGLPEGPMTVELKRAERSARVEVAANGDVAVK